jgi:Rieske 2Fe-2S family protein
MRPRTSAEVFAWERRHFFGSGWTCAGHASRLPTTGDQLAVGSGRRRRHRGEDGAIQAFANTCRHRGLSCCRAAEHGERQGHRLPVPLVGVLAGRLQPRCRGLAAADWSLRELPAVEWHGLIFVDGSGGAAGPLPLAGLDELVAPYEPSRLVTAATHTYDAAANWKILTENYHECYHCPAIHAELCSVSPATTGEG